METYWDSNLLTVTNRNQVFCNAIFGKRKIKAAQKMRRALFKFPWQSSRQHIQCNIEKAVK